jgi:hypothetical protein
VFALFSCLLCQGPYEEIQALLHSAAVTSAGLESLDSPGPPRVVEVHHHHKHLVPHDMPAEVAEHIAVQNTPAPAPVRVIAVKSPTQAARHAAEDAEYHRHMAEPSVSSVTHVNSLTVSLPDNRVHADVKPRRCRKCKGAKSGVTTIKGQRGDTRQDKPWDVKGSGFHFPLVDRRLKKATFQVIAETDGAHRADPNFKPHTAKELQAEALRLLKRAKQIQARRNKRAAAAAAAKKENEALGIFDSKDDGYEDELTRLKRVSARMNRLLEQIQTPHNQDTFEGSIARKKYFLKIYKSLKKDATKIIEAYALRTGHSIFEVFGDGKIDPSIAAFLPPNSVAGILAQYANPTQGRSDETPRDILSGRDAKRIQYSIDYYRAKKFGKKLPMPPVFAPTAEEERQAKLMNNKNYNQIVAQQRGEFGQGRPAVTAGKSAMGRSSVHISVINPTETQHERGLPYQVNLKSRGD